MYYGYIQNRHSLIQYKRFIEPEFFVCPESGVDILQNFVSLSKECNRKRKVLNFDSVV